MAPPRLANPVFQRRTDGELRTVTRREPRRPISGWHTGRWWLGHHLDRENDGEWADTSPWAAHRTAPGRVRGVTRADRRADLRLARHAQDLRAEAAGLGGAEETRAFYRDENTAAASTSERRIRVSTTETADAAYEREQATRYAGRRRRSGQAALARYRDRRPGGV